MAAQGLILSEGSRRKRRAPVEAGPQARVSSGGGCSYSRVYRRLEGGWGGGSGRKGWRGRDLGIRRPLIGWGSCMPLEDWLMSAQKASRGSTETVAFPWRPKGT